MCDKFLLSMNYSVIRPTDVGVGGLRFYWDSSIFYLSSSSFFSQLLYSSLSGTQPKPVTCSEVSAI